MAFAIGVALSLGMFSGATAIGLDRDRALYPTALMFIAAYYVLFAVMGASGPIVMAETAVAGVFILVAALGFKWSLWIVAAGLVGHGLFDFLHPLVYENPGVPDWWPAFCSAADLAAGGYLSALLLTRSSPLSRAAGAP